MPEINVATVAAQHKCLGNCRECCVVGSEIMLKVRLDQKNPASQKPTMKDTGQLQRRSRIAAKAEETDCVTAAPEPETLNLPVFSVAFGGKVKESAAAQVPCWGEHSQSANLPSV